MVDLMGNDTCDTCLQQDLNCCEDWTGKIYCSKICPIDEITISSYIKGMSTHLHELGGEVEKFSNVKFSDKAANDILTAMELTLQNLGQDTRDIGKKVSSEKDYIHSEHFWNKTASYLDDLSSSVHRINADIK